MNNKTNTAMAENMDSNALYSLVSRKAEIVFNSFKGYGFYSLDDLIIEGATKVWRGIGSFSSSKSPLDAWVYLIVKRVWFDMLHKEALEKGIFTPLVRTNEDGDEYEVSSSYNCSYDSYSISDIEEMESMEHIMSVVKSLPNDSYRKSMELSIYGYDNDEIAEKMGCDKKNVASWLCRARKQIEANLGDDMPRLSGRRKGTRHLEEGPGCPDPSCFFIACTASRPRKCCHIPLSYRSAG